MDHTHPCPPMTDSNTFYSTQCKVLLSVVGRWGCYHWWFHKHQYVTSELIESLKKDLDLNNKVLDVKQIGKAIESRTFKESPTCGTLRVS